MACSLIVPAGTSNADLGDRGDIMQLVVLADGSVRCLYGEELDLHRLGQLTITRGSHVEPTPEGQWTADLSPVDGPQLGPFRSRGDALEAERDWLERHWL